MKVYILIRHTYYKCGESNYCIFGVYQNREDVEQKYMELMVKENDNDDIYFINYIINRCEVE